MIYFFLGWQLDGTQVSSSLDLLHLFAYGTWNDYKSTSLFSFHYLKTSIFGCLISYHNLSAYSRFMLIACECFSS